LNCKFLVCGRTVLDRHHTFKDVVLPTDLADIFSPLDFRMDVSSTQIREKHGKAARG